MKNSKKVTALLLLLTVGIWGSIAYRLYDSVATKGAEINLTLPQGSDSRPYEQKYIYVHDVRDPFRYVPKAHVDSLKKTMSAKSKPVWAPPPFKLTGILLANKKKTVMLEGANGSAFFLHEGDTLSGVRIVKIKDKIVSYTYQKEHRDWTLENP